MWLKNEPRVIGKSCLWLNLTHCGGSRSWLLNLLTTLTYGSSVRNSWRVDFDAGDIVADAGLLAVRTLERPLRVIADLAPLLPDPRSPLYVRHSVEAILTQEVYSLLAGYPDHNDADQLRDDLLFQVLADVNPDLDQPLASGSTLARFQYAYTRRKAEILSKTAPSSSRSALPN